MKRIKLSYIIYFLPVFLLLAGCEDFLVQTPRLQQTNELTLSTYKGLNSATVGAYTQLYATQWYGRDFEVTADLKGGNAKISPITSGRFVQEYLWTNNSNNTINTWTVAYDAIARANNVINALDGFSEPDITKSQIDQLKGECLFIRAMGFFDLVRMYAQPYTSGRDQLGVPVVLVTEMGKPARNTVGETYDQVVKDLLAAEKLLPEKVSRDGAVDDKGWASIYAAQALLARVYLYMGEWQKAADYATKIINSPNYRLYKPAEYTTWDKNGVWGTDAAPEIIFEIYGSEGNSSHGNWDMISYILSPDGYGDVGASHDLYNLYSDNDVRKNMFTNTADFPNALWSLKYPGKGGNLRIDNIPILRLSEMYLIRMESILNGASVSGVTALADYNTLREKRGLADEASVSLTNVYNERRRELCFEGQELFDLSRTKRGLTRSDYDGAVNQNIPFPDYRWAMPIPRGEIDANPNVEQNPKY